MWHGYIFEIAPTPAYACFQQKLLQTSRILLEFLKVDKNMSNIPTSDP